MRTSVWRIRKILGRWRANCPDGTYPCQCWTFDDRQGAVYYVRAKLRGEW